jgi:phosphohistidine phosphatase
MMILYVVRHAEAVETSKTLPDEWRYLTKKGRATVKKMRSRISQYGPEPGLIITSPLVRAVQTAEILVENIKRKNEVIANGFLQPGADINQLIEYLKKLKNTDCMMVVGHEPFVSSLVRELLGETDESFKKGACVALETRFDRNKKSSFLWYLAPGEKVILQPR